MRKQTPSLILLAALVLPGAAGATLIDRGGGLIYDDVLDITWLQDANYAQTSGFAAANAVDNGTSATDNIFADGRMGWDAAVAWADGLSYFDSVRGMTWDDWRLPSADVNGDDTVINCFGGGVAGCADNEMGYLFWEEGITAAAPSPFSNVQSNHYWSGSEFALSPSGAWSFNFFNGLQLADGKEFELFAWAVRPGDVAAQGVPEPGTLALLGAALGLFGLRRRARRHSVIRSLG